MKGTDIPSKLTLVTPFMNLTPSYSRIYRSIVNWGAFKSTLVLYIL